MAPVATILVVLLLAATTGAVGAQPREWPSRNAAAGPAEDPPMGLGGECRHEGRRIDQGETACIGHGGDRRMARCGMMLNNTSWITQETRCTSE